MHQLEQCYILGNSDTDVAYTTVMTRSDPEGEVGIVREALTHTRSHRIFELAQMQMSSTFAHLWTLFRERIDCGFHPDVEARLMDMINDTRMFLIEGRLTLLSFEGFARGWETYRMQRYQEIDQMSWTRLFARLNIPDALAERTQQILQSAIPKQFLDLVQLDQLRRQAPRAEHPYCDWTDTQLYNCVSSWVTGGWNAARAQALANV